MGEIRLDVPGFETDLWPPYMSNLLQEVVRDWALRVENGSWKTFIHSSEPISAEHLRIAKTFVTSEPNQAFDPNKIPAEVLDESKRKAGDVST